MRVAAVWVAALGVALAACGGGGGGGAVPSSQARPSRMALRSPAFAAGRPIPARFTCDGQDASPPLRFVAVPASARSLALVVDDPDAPGGTFTHWLVWGLAPRTEGLPAGVPEGARQWGGVALRQGRNDFGRTGYGGPCPPRGATHRYVFRLIALDTVPALPAGARRAAFERALAGHAIAQARLVTLYGRR